ncbi:hypothetical protein FKM82_000693 [Ascaphus truei]
MSVNWPVPCCTKVAEAAASSPKCTIPVFVRIPPALTDQPDIMVGFSGARGGFHKFALTKGQSATNRFSSKVSSSRTLHCRLIPLNSAAVPTSKHQ